MNDHGVVEFIGWEVEEAAGGKAEVDSRGGGG